MKKFTMKPARANSGQSDLPTETGPVKYFNHLIEKGLYFLLLFTPLAFGGVQPWAFTIMEFVAFIVFGAWLLRMCVLKKIEFYATPLLFCMLALAVVGLVQIIPMPQAMLGLISPSSLTVYKTFAIDTEPVWRPISIDPQSTIDDIWKLLSYTAVFAVIIDYFKTRAQVGKIIKFIIWLGLAIAIFAVVQRLAWNGRIYWIFPVRPGLEFSKGHIWGPYINHNHFAGYMELVVPLALGYFLYRLTDVKVMPDMPILRKLHIYASNNAMMQMVFFLVSAFVMTGALFMSSSRGGIIGLTTGAIVFMAMSFKRKTLKDKAAILAAIGAVLIVFVVFLSWGRLEDRFGDIAEEGKNPRLDVLADSTRLVRDFPVLGTGLGTFKSSYLSYQTKYSTMLFLNADNDFLEILVDTGLAGFVVVVSIIFFFFYPVVRVWAVRQNRFVKCMAAAGVASCSALVAHSFFDFNMHIPANAMLITVIAGITYAVVFNVSERGRHNAVKKF